METSITFSCARNVRMEVLPSARKKIILKAKQKIIHFKAKKRHISSINIQHASDTICEQCFVVVQSNCSSSIEHFPDLQDLKTSFNRVIIQIWMFPIQGEHLKKK